MGHPMTLRFTGSGAEYFRIWIVNLLLILVTLGLYYPWAKVRRLRYFYSNTWVESSIETPIDATTATTGGGHALDFHGAPLRMLAGYLIMGALFVVYTVGGNLSPFAAAFAFAVLAAVVPPLYCAGLRFRLANTSWRGLRFGFAGRAAGAYRVFLPLLVPLLLLVTGLVIASGGGGEGGEARSMAPVAGVSFGAAVVLGYALVPWVWYRIRRFQHEHYRFGSLAARLEIGPGAIYRLLMKTAGVSLLALIALAAIAAAAGWLFGPAVTFGAGNLAGQRLPPDLAGAVVVGVLVFAAGSFIAGQFVVLPYAVARQQNLFWSATRSDAIRFDSRLSFARLARLTALNWLLVLLTLGLYRPFAAIATARLRIEAVSLALRDAPEAILGEARRRKGSAAGDAAADLFGFDVGL